MLNIPDKKDKYKDGAIISLSKPQIFHIPLYGYNNDLQMLLAEGERVLKYQLLAQSDAILTGNVHAPASGIIGKTITVSNHRYVELFNDFEEQEYPLEKTEISTLTLDAFTAKLCASGIEGSGGARFPTALKYQIGDRMIDTLIINGAECEPFLSADYAVMKNFSDQIVQVATLILRLIKSRRIVIGIELQHKLLKPLFEKAFKENKVNGIVKILPNSYPQGGELQLIQSVTGKAIPKGTLPADHGVIVNNVSTLLAIYHAIYEGRPYTERVVTLYNQIRNIGENHWMSIGTPISHMIDFFSEHTDKKNTKLIVGGPMMGKPAGNLDQSVDKGTGGILLLKTKKRMVSNCIDCGYCVDVCPQQLLPLEFVRNYSLQNKNHLQKYNLSDCIECGACDYSCPSNIPLMQSIRVGKKLIMN